MHACACWGGLKFSWPSHLQNGKKSNFKIISDPVADEFARCKNRKKKEVGHEKPQVEAELEPNKQL